MHSASGDVEQVKIVPTCYVKEPKGWIEFFWSEDDRVEFCEEGEG